MHSHKIRHQTDLDLAGMDESEYRAAIYYAISSRSKDWIDRFGNLIGQGVVSCFALMEETHSQELFREAMVLCAIGILERRPGPDKRDGKDCRWFGFTKIGESLRELIEDSYGNYR